MNEAAARKEEHGRKGVTKRTKGSGKGRKRKGKKRSARRGNEKACLRKQLAQNGLLSHLFLFSPVAQAPATDARRLGVEFASLLCCSTPHARISI